jgi:hypothetical protein
MTSHARDAARRRGDPGTAAWLDGRWRCALDLAADLTTLADGPPLAVPDPARWQLLDALAEVERQLLGTDAPSHAAAAARRYPASTSRSDISGIGRAWASRSRAKVQARSQARRLSSRSYTAGPPPRSAAR